jgi:hypothetical protein
MDDAHESLANIHWRYVNSRTDIEGRPRPSDPRHMPGAALMAMTPMSRAQLVAAINGRPPADWWIKLVVPPSRPSRG